jgi:hypothetical protein
VQKQKNLLPPKKVRDMIDENRRREQLKSDLLVKGKDFDQHNLSQL